jgi:hypothetical protein
LNIVATSENVHHAIATQDEAEVFAFAQHFCASNRAVGQKKAEELASVVLLTQLDVLPLTPDDIAGLLADGMGLQHFKSALIPSVQTMADIGSLQDRALKLEGSPFCS